MDRRVKDVLLARASNAQRSAGIIPTPADNGAFLDEVLTRMDRKEADLPGAPPRSTKVTNAATGESSTMDPGHRSKYLESGVSVNPAVRWTALTKKMWKRVDQMKRDPYWSNQLRRVNPLALSGSLGKEKRFAAAKYLRRMLEESNRTFGDWRKDEAKPLLFDVGGVKLR